MGEEQKQTFTIDPEKKKGYFSHLADARKEMFEQYIDVPKYEFGRPTDFTPELVFSICDLLAMGKSLQKICESADMPSQRTVYTWLLKYPDFLQIYRQAREWQAETWHDQTIDIAEESTDPNDKMCVQRNRLRVDARKWLCEVGNPRKYGKQVRVDQTVTIETHEQRLRRIAEAHRQALPEPIEVEGDKGE